MTKCKHCKVEKPESEMSVWNGKSSKVCNECKPKHPVGGGARNGNGGGATRKKSPAAVSRRKPNTAVLEIEVPGGGHGFKASLTDEDCLLITQENADADADNIVLTRGEAKTMFALFGDWAAE